ncbi:MAG: hypothetical protein P9X24_07350 [Candidatus Hatepunaea meridiana]|nr:hypothetical protein [Candidatus Hatepunaea meridiana]
MKPQKVIFLLISIMLSLQPCLAEESWRISQVNRMFNFWQTANAVEVEGDYAYVCTGLSGLQVVDVSSPDYPLPVSYFDDTPSEMKDFVLVDNHAVAIYSGANGVRAGMCVIDVSDPLNPELIHQHDFDHYVSTIKRYGDEIIILGSHYYHFDVSDLDNPRIINHFALSGTDFAYRDNFLYIIGNNQLRVIDISDRNEHEIVYERDIERPFRIESRDTLLFIVGRTQGLYTFDISDPADPEMLSLFEMQNPSYMHVLEDLVYLTYDSGVQIIDVSDPTHPTVRYNYVSYYHRFKAHSFQDDALFALNYSSRLEVFHVGEHDTVVMVGNLNYNLYSGSLYHCVATEDHIYVSDYNDLRTIDATDPQNLRERGSYSAPGRIQDIAIYGETIALSIYRTGIRILNISNPNQPRAVGYDNSFNRVKRSALDENLLYIATEDSGLFILDISQPVHPQRVARFPEEGRYSASDIALSGNSGYLVHQTELIRLDLTDPNNPQVAGTFQLNRYSSAGSIAVSGDCVFLRISESQNIMVDFSNPDEPHQVLRFNSHGITRDFFVQGDYLYLADGKWGGLRVYDHSDPDTLVEVGWYDTPGDAYGVFAFGERAYVADYTNIGIYDLSEAVGIPDGQHPVIPDRFTLLSVYPNPFNEWTRITFTLQKNVSAKLSVFDPLGRVVANLIPSHCGDSGQFQAVWKPETSTSSSYFLLLETVEAIQVVKLTIIR